MMTFLSYITERMQQKHDFSSTQVNLPHDLAAAVTGWGQLNIQDSDVYNGEPGLGREDEPHATILYGLYETNPNKIKQALKDIKPFEVKLGQISLFTTNPLFDVIKIDVNSKDLTALNKLLKSKFPHHNSYPTYNAHVTIAYLKKGKGKIHNKDDFFKGKKFKATEIIFSGRNGVKTKIALN